VNEDSFVVISIMLLVFCFTVGECSVDIVEALKGPCCECEK